LESNCYIFEMPKHCLVIDPGDCGAQVGGWLRANHAQKHVDLFLTHGHVNHILGVPSLCQCLSSPTIFCSRDDLDFFNTPRMNQSQSTGQSTSLADLNRYFKFVGPQDKIKLDSDSFRVLALPGHTPGSLGLYCEAANCVFVGDTLFKGGIGRTDGLGGDFSAILRSIKGTLLALPDATVVLPGHGPETTIGREKRWNSWIRSWRKTDKEAAA
jgi:glyoxylase-like metal-dependent hydrolase (beta-lactamase superfamily II)